MPEHNEKCKWAWGNKELTDFEHTYPNTNSCKFSNTGLYKTSPQSSSIYLYFGLKCIKDAKESIWIWCFNPGICQYAFFNTKQNIDGRYSMIFLSLCSMNLPLNRTKQPVTSMQAMSDTSLQEHR
jgi:hypothetical protein